MAKINIDVDKYLDDKSWAAKMLIYDYSEPDLITDTSLVNLLSIEKRRLHIRDGLYQLYNKYGEFYINHASFPDFKSQLAQIMTEDNPQILSTETPNLPIIIEMINELKKIGLRVVGSKQVCYESWNVVYDNMLLYDLQTSGTDIDNYMRQETKDGQEVMTNPQDVVSLKKHIHKRGIYSWELVKYDIIDSSGKHIISQIPMDILGPVILSLILNIQPKSIKRMLLFPRIPNDIMTDPDLRLRFERKYHSDYISVDSISDVKLLDHVPIKRDEEHSFNTFQFLNSHSYIDYGNDIAEDDSRDALLPIFHDLPEYNAKDAKKLSNWIIQTANKANVYIQRRERRQLDACDIDHFEIKDGQIVDLLAENHSYDPGYLYESVFAVFDKQTKDLLRRDLSIGELTIYILSLLINE